MATLTGTCDYVNTLGPTLKDRSAFDGSVPYTITTSADLQWTNILSSSTDNATVFFCLNGVAGEYTFGPGAGGAVHDAMKTALSRQCGIRLRDIHIGFPQDVTKAVVDIYVGDPTQSPPAINAVNSHLWFGRFEGSTMRIPDMDGLVVAAGLNVMVKITMSWSGSGTKKIIFHSVCDIDD